jgi:hypothetical protein
VSSAGVDGPAGAGPPFVLGRGVPHHAGDHVDPVAAQREMQERLGVLIAGVIAQAQAPRPEQPR